MPTLNCKCVRCDFRCDAGKWCLDGQTRDCYGCDGTGFEVRCDACFGEECTACEERVKEPQRDTDGLPFCDGCFAELKKEMNDVK